jgi:hypothetical protein
VNITGNYICTNTTLSIPSGVANFNSSGTVSPALLTLNATLSGSNAVTVLTQGTWSGGVMSGNGRTIIAPSATFTINNPGSVTLNSRTLDNAGTVLWTGAGAIALNGGVITNRPGSLFQAQSSAALGNGGGVNRFDNTGTFRKTSSGTTIINNNIMLQNSGVVEIRRGVLRANGGYTSTGNALLNFALGGTTAGTDFGQLQVAGSVTLNGSVSVDLSNGFAPAVNDSFTVVSAGTRNGAFANFFYPSNDVTMQLSNTPSTVVVRVTDAHFVPRLVLFQPELLGSELRLTWTAISNTTYRVEFNADLISSNWSNLSGDVIGVSNTASKLDPLAMGYRFYRVLLIRP